MTSVLLAPTAKSSETPSGDPDPWRDLFDATGVGDSRISSSQGGSFKGVNPEGVTITKKKRALPDPSHYLYPELKTAAKKRKKPSRTQLRFPTLRRVYAKKRERTDGTVIHDGESYQKDIWRYLVAVGMRMQWDRHDSDKRLHTADELASLFLEVTEAKAITWDNWDVGKIGISRDYLPIFTTDAADAVICDRDEEYKRKAAVRGRIGGMRSKRGKKYTPDMLDALHGLSIAQQARALGCDPSTIKRLRAEQKAIRTDS